MGWASYHIRKIAGCACAWNAGNVFPRRRFQRETLVSDPGMHHGTCVTHVPWCMSGSLTCGDGENVPGIPGACAPTILRIWQEAHGFITQSNSQSQSLIPQNTHHISPAGRSYGVSIVRICEMLTALWWHCIELPADRQCKNAKHLLHFNTSKAPHSLHFKSEL